MIIYGRHKNGFHWSVTNFLLKRYKARCTSTDYTVIYVKIVRHFYHFKPSLYLTLSKAPFLNNGNEHIQQKKDHVDNIIKPIGKGVWGEIAVRTYSNMTHVKLLHCVPLCLRRRVNHPHPISRETTSDNKETLFVWDSSSFFYFSSATCSIHIFGWYYHWKCAGVKKFSVTPTPVYFRSGQRYLELWAVHAPVHVLWTLAQMVFTADKPACTWQLQH